jgi:hypothetical protein
MEFNHNELENHRHHVEALNRACSRVVAYDDDPVLARCLEEIAPETEERLEALLRSMTTSVARR